MLYMFRTDFPQTDLLNRKVTNGLYQILLKRLSPLRQNEKQIRFSLLSGALVRTFDIFGRGGERPLWEILDFLEEIDSNGYVHRFWLADEQLR